MKFIGIGRIKAEILLYFRRYIASGAINEDMIDIWLETASKSFGRSSKPTKEAVVSIKNYVGDLPCDFEDVKSIWICKRAYSPKIEADTSVYYVDDCRITRIDEKCNECTYQNYCDNCNTIPKKYQVVNKVTGSVQWSYDTEERMYPYKAGMEKLTNSYKIEGENIHTKIRDGELHLEYKSSMYDEDGELLVPDDHKVKLYLIEFIRYKIMEDIMYNDENQSNYRINLNNYQVAENGMLIAKVNAETNLKQWSRKRTANAINRRRSRHTNYRRIMGK